MKLFKLTINETTKVASVLKEMDGETPVYCASIGEVHARLNESDLYVKIASEEGRFLVKKSYIKFVAPADVVNIEVPAEAIELTDDFVTFNLLSTFTEYVPEVVDDPDTTEIDETAEAVPESYTFCETMDEVETVLVDAGEFVLANRLGLDSLAELVVMNKSFLMYVR